MDHDFLMIDLPKTAAAWEEGRLAELEEALGHDISPKLFELVEDACRSGGAPDDEQYYIDDIQITADRLTADVTVTFTEQIPSGCSDMPHEVDREHRVVITLDAGESTGVVQASDSEPNQWDLIDRNSAADGK